VFHQEKGPVESFRRTRHRKVFAQVAEGLFVRRFRDVIGFTSGNRSSHPIAELRILALLNVLAERPLLRV
jgi:hypothetical protein